DYLHTKRLMYEEPEGWNRLMGILVDATARYLNRQIAAGAEAVQVFDSWVGVLAPDDYRTFVLPHTRALIRALTPGIPVIHFGTGTAALLPSMRAAGGDVIGLDWRVDLDLGWAAVGHDVAVQGNLDPVVLLSKPAYIRQRVKDILDRAGGRPGHIFNLGHGMLQQTLTQRGPTLPVFVGMRNWHPFLYETLAEMAGKGARRTLAIILSPLRTEASWDRYIQDVAEARARVAGAPEVGFAPAWFEN